MQQNPLNNTLNANKKKSKLTYLLYLVILIVLVAVIYMLCHTFRESSLTKKANTNSLVFNNIQEQLMQGNKEEAIKLLNLLAKNGTNGYQLVAKLQQASLALTQKNYSHAVSELQSINNLKVPSYYKSLAQYIIYSIRLDTDKNIPNLINDIRTHLTTKNAFYYPNLELLSVALYLNKQYDLVISNTDKIINSKVNNNLKERAKSLKSLALAYVK